jgi:hypothetical protein
MSTHIEPGMAGITDIIASIEMHRQQMEKAMGRGER